MTERDELLKEYREMTLMELIELRFYYSHERSTIEQVIFEKVKELERKEAQPW